MLSFQDLLNEINQHNIDEQLALFAELGLSLSHKNLDLAKISILFQEKKTDSHQKEIATTLKTILSASSNGSNIVNVDTTTVFEGRIIGPNDFQVWVIGKDDVEKLPLSEYGNFISPAGYSWGRDTAGQIALAHSILTYQFDIPTADEYAWEFDDQKLKNFVLTRKNVPSVDWKIDAQEIKIWLDNTIATKPDEYDWKSDYANYLAEKYK